MEIGTDTDGRSISFDEATGHLSIGGIATTIDRLVAYDRGGQVAWASPEIRDWAHEYESRRAEYVSELQAAQAAMAAQQAASVREARRRTSLTATGYDHSAALSLAGQLRGLAVLIMAGSAILGASIGVVLGAASGIRTMSVIMLMVFGGGGLLLGYLGTFAIKAVSHVLTSLVQIEMNTRPRNDSQLD